MRVWCGDGWVSRWAGGGRVGSKIAKWSREWPIAEHAWQRVMIRNVGAERLQRALNWLLLGATPRGTAPGVPAMPSIAKKRVCLTNFVPSVGREISQNNGQDFEYEHCEEYGWPGRIHDCWESAWAGRGRDCKHIRKCIRVGPIADHAHPLLTNINVGPPRT